jgi:hypothetical protein
MVDKEVGRMASERDPGKVEARGVNRRSFLQTSGGVATGLAVVAVPPAALAMASPAAAKENRLVQRVEPSGDVPSETVMAYVHDAQHGVVTVVSGTSEKTYRDPVLAKRLLDAARAA